MSLFTLFALTKSIPSATIVIQLIKTMLKSIFSMESLSKRHGLPSVDEIEDRICKVYMSVWVPLGYRAADLRLYLKQVFTWHGSICPLKRVCFKQCCDIAVQYLLSTIWFLFLVLTLNRSLWPMTDWNAVWKNIIIFYTRGLTGAVVSVVDPGSRPGRVAVRCGLEQVTHFPPALNSTG